MRLITLGELRLEGSTFTETQPLLLLSYLALNGRCLRGEVQELFWAHQPDKTKRIKSLSTALGRLKKVSPNLLETKPAYLESYLLTDTEAFQRAVAEKRFEDAYALYSGIFLHGLERTRVRLGEELETWLTARRAALQSDFVKVLLALADEQVREGNVCSARDYVLRALELPEAVTPPPVQALVRMQGLLASAGFRDEAERVAERAHALYGQPTLFSPLPPPPSGQARDTLVGRETELAELARQFGSGVQLVNVTGLAGVGKTALARAFLLQAFPLFDKVYFLSLTSLGEDATPETLWRALAECLELDPLSTPVEEQVTDHLRGEPALLVLDNFETFLHLRPVLVRLLTCPTLGILVTSRERLGLAEEYVVPLRGLEAPVATTLVEIGRSASGRLLLAEADKRSIGFHETDAPHLAALCQHTAGLPLALKLAAGWLPSLPLPDLVNRLRSSLHLLASSADGVSLAAAFDVSVDLLDAETRTLFLSLGVFVDGFSLSAAEAVAGAQPYSLRRLVDASLLNFDGARYTLHPLMRQYLVEREAPGSAARHAHYYLTLLEGVASNHQARADQALQQLKDDLGNLSAAWVWTVRQTDTLANRELRLAGLQRLCNLLALPHRGLELIEIVLCQHTQASPYLRASRAWFLLRLGRYDEVLTEADHALRNLPDGCATQETCLNASGAANDSLGNFDKAKKSFQTALELAAPNSNEAANALVNLAVNALVRGDYESARYYLAQGEEVFTVLSKPVKLVWCAYVAGWLALETCDTLRARLKLEQARAAAKSLDSAHWATLCEIKWAALLAAEGHTERAKVLCEQILREVQTNKLTSKASRTLTLLGDVHIKRKEPRVALRHFKDGLKLSNTLGGIPTLLQNSIGILQSLVMLEASEGRDPLYDLLYSYCRDRSTLMFYKDRQTLQALPPARDKAWTTLNTGEVARLTLSLLEEGML